MLKRESNQNWMKARVCHSLPGRLRLTATGLRYLPDEGRALAETLVRFGGMRRVRLQDIRYVEVDRHFVLYHMADEVIESRDTLAAVEERLRPAHFLRCAKSFLVNPRHITAVDGMQIRVGGEEIVYISGNRRKSFLQEFAAWQSGRG